MAFREVIIDNGSESRPVTLLLKLAEKAPLSLISYSRILYSAVRVYRDKLIHGALPERALAD